MAKKFSPKVGDIVHIVWEDHCTFRDAGWISLKQAAADAGPALCETVGFVVAVTAKYLTLTSSLDDGAPGERHGSSFQTRLRNCIVAGRVLPRARA